MAANGSRRWFQYSSDTGVTFAVELDESTYETADLAFAPIDTGASGPTAQGRVLTVSSSRPLTMRSVRGFRVDGSDVIRKRFYVGTQAALAALFASPTLTIAGEGNYSLTSFKGEERKLVPATDTGQTDGDVDSNIVV